jgi:hypothetical protein
MGAKNSTFAWDNLIDHTMAIGTPEIEMVLFRQNPFADPCALMGQNIVNIATDLARRNERVAYVTGYGECTHCRKPTVYSLPPTINAINQGWLSQTFAHRSDLSNYLHGLISSDSLNYVYVVLGDQHLTINKVKNVYRLVNGNFQLLPGCNPGSSRRDIVAGSQANWIALIILILLIIFIIIIILRTTRKPKGTYSVIKK